MALATGKSIAGSRSDFSGAVRSLDEAQIIAESCAVGRGKDRKSRSLVHRETFARRRSRALDRVATTGSRRDSRPFLRTGANRYDKPVANYLTLVKLATIRLMSPRPKGA
jgi:hypothetical protein